MNRFMSLLTVLLLIAGTAGAQTTPPINLQAELVTGGQVNLAWDPPPDGLVEDFEDGEANDFGTYPDPTDWMVEDGYFKALGDAATWQCAWWTGMQFTDFTLEAVFVPGNNSTSSRGVQFRADGPRDNDYNGYNFYIGSSSYSIYNFIDGSYGDGISWTTSPDIVGDGENTLKVVGSGDSFDLYINGVYQETYVNSDHASGMPGLIAASSAGVWFDEITCFPSADMVPAGQRVTERQRLSAEEINELGLTGPLPEMAEIPGPPAPAVDDLDEFINYRVYVNDTFIGSTEDTTFVHQLPTLGEYFYNVTAYYDEGESGYSNTATVNWEAATISLTGTTTTIPENGGTVVYTLDFAYQLGFPINGVNYWTSVVLPNGQPFGPTSNVTANLTPFMTVSIPGMTQAVPALAPPGTYEFIGSVGFYPNAIASGSFTFEKLGAAAAGGALQPVLWPADASGFASAGGQDGTVRPETFALEEVWPNPFNPTATVHVTLPHTSELTVRVVNLAGQTVATIAEGSYAPGRHALTVDGTNLASGIYFVQAVVPGELNKVRKVTLLK